MASRRAQQQENTRLHVMRLINQDSKLTTREIANETGISNGSAFYIMTALVEKGFVKLSNFKKSARKDQYIRLLTAKGMREKSLLTQRFIKHKQMEYELLKQEIEELEKEVRF